MEMTLYHIDPKHMFSNELSFLDNAHPCFIRMSVLGQNHVFRSAEAAFQAGKCTSSEDVLQFTTVASPAEAKRLGNHIHIREDWDLFKVTWMQRVLLCKFTQNPILLGKLIDTYPLPLVASNTEDDLFWGKCNGIGKNQLGAILMEIREIKRDIPVSDSDLADVVQFPV